MDARKVRARSFQALMILSLAVSMGVLIWLLVGTFIDGIPALDKKLFANPPSSLPEEAGARPAILATLYIAVLVLLLSVPIGVCTAIYLEEYANKERWYNRLLEINIQNLAAVPQHPQRGVAGFGQYATEIRRRRPGKRTGQAHNGYPRLAACAGQSIDRIHYS